MSEEKRLEQQRKLLMGGSVTRRPVVKIQRMETLITTHAPTPTDNIKIAVVIPTRGDRPAFLEHANYLLRYQTRQPDSIRIIDYPPSDGKMDLVERYRTGCQSAFADGADLVLPWEDDDWYDRDYIKIMCDQWVASGHPVLMGLKGTIYYHIGQRKYQQLLNPKRATMACSAITKEAMNIPWNPHNQFLDLFLWKRLKGEIFEPKRPIHIGVKHNVGLCGGMGHKVLSMYRNEDKDLKFLGNIVDNKSLEFYSNFPGCSLAPVPGAEKPVVNESTVLTDIIIPSYKNEEYTINCIRSIRRCTPAGTYRIIWVDNGSIDASKVFPEIADINHIKVLLQKNEGFVGAVNHGMRISTAPNVCLLNNDTVVSPRWLDKMVTTLNKNQELGIIGCLTGPPGKAKQYDSHHNIACQQEFRVTPVFPEFTTLDKFNSQIEKQFPGMLGDVDFVAFLCAVIKREVINKVGVLDKNYAMGMWDDCDYNRAATKAGYKSKLLLDTCIYHKGRTTFNLLIEKEGLDVHSLLVKNRTYLDKKWGTK